MISSFRKKWLKRDDFLSWECWVTFLLLWNNQFSFELIRACFCGYFFNRYYHYYCFKSLIELFNSSLLFYTQIYNFHMPYHVFSSSSPFFIVIVIIIFLSSLLTEAVIISFIKFCIAFEWSLLWKKLLNRGVMIITVNITFILFICILFLVAWERLSVLNLFNHLYKFSNIRRVILKGF